MVTRLVSLSSAVGTLAAAAANLGCCGLGVFGPAGAAGAASGAATLVPATWGYPTLYGSLALTLAGLGMHARRHRPSSPSALGFAGALLLLLAFHEAWDVAVFATLVVGGSAMLVAAAAFDVSLPKRACRRSFQQGR